MSGRLRCWPGCLAELIAGPNVGRRVVVGREVSSDEHPFPERGAAWYVTALSSVRVALETGRFEVGRTLPPFAHGEVIAFDCDLRPILPNAEDESTTTDAAQPVEVQA